MFKRVDGRSSENHPHAALNNGVDGRDKPGHDRVWS
jgi:hypothetical protein